MTPKDREDLTALLARVSRLDGMPRDPESDRLVGDALSRQPTLPYIMAQALLAQQEALVDAQRRLADLQENARSSTAAPPPFRGSDQSASGQSNGPWGQQSYQPQPQPPYGQQQAYGQQPPAYGQPAYGAPPVYAQPRSFMRGMFETMAGVAGGVLAADAVESLFRGGHGGGLGGGFGGSPWGGGGDRIDETVVNNTTVNETIINEGGGSTDRTSFDQGRQDGGYQDADYQTDNSFDDGGFDDGSIDT
ncbi:MAG: DUF2076 domain-containing protein [Azospirillaceae bacterium]|nr:DUF2076 domain-containing protein [Azospirillaceae bacterium]